MSDQAYWTSKDEKLVGRCAGMDVIGIPATGAYPPAVLLRHPRSGEAVYFTLKSAAALAFLLSLWIQEQGAKVSV